MSLDAADLVVIVPTRLRPHTVAPMCEAFADTCTSDTWLLFAVDGCRRAAEYIDAWQQASVHTYSRSALSQGPRRRLVGTLNHYATQLATAAHPPAAIAYLGDDHRPRTVGWDSKYLSALAATGGGIVYGNDLVQGESLPTQVAVSADIVRALGYLAPPVLAHMYCDNYWKDLGQAADCLTYLPAVTVEHLHPSTGRTSWDASYRESNAAGSYAVDQAAYAQFRVSGLPRDIAVVRSLREKAK